MKTEQDTLTNKEKMEKKLSQTGEYVKALIKTIVIFIIFYWILHGFSINYNKEV